jgi:putative membrane protein
MSLGTLLPPVNAALNAAGAGALLAGWRAIRTGDRARHRRRMLSAFACSVVFLVGYVTRVLLTGTHRFPGGGALRAGYLVLLASHTLLAAACAPLVLLTLNAALKERFEGHRKLARVTFPIWLYVSATGVLVYYFLYHLAPGRAS